MSVRRPKYPMPSWAVAQIIRSDRRDCCVEDICNHGVGHPNQTWLQTQLDSWAGVHGCDGCCHKPNAST